MKALTLEEVYRLASQMKYYEFRNTVDELLAGTPPTVESKNEFILILAQ